MGHYTVDGVEFPSVTTVSGIVAKPNLIQWSANMATDYIIEHLEEIIAEPNVHRRMEIIEEARYAHDKYRKMTADIGTAAHEAIESFIKDGTTETKDLQDDVKEVFLSFIDWCNQQQPFWIASERKLHSLTLGVAGTCDAIAKINGVLCMIDFKTSKTLYVKDACLQLAGYATAYKEEGEPFGKIERYILLHLDWREGTVNTVDVSKKIPIAKISYSLLCDFFYSYAKRRIKNPRVKEFY